MLELEQWREYYATAQAHSSLGNISPVKFARKAA